MQAHHITLEGNEATVERVTVEEITINAERDATMSGYKGAPITGDSLSKMHDANSIDFWHWLYHHFDGGSSC